jgi:hypothetical protein
MLQLGAIEKEEKEFTNHRYVRFIAFSSNKCAKTFSGDKPYRF